LIFEKLTIQNFIPFFGTQELEFSIDPEKNVSLIRGYKNGAGKTSIFQLITWILFDEKEFKYLKESDLKGEKTLKAVVNNKAKDDLDEFDVGGMLEFSIYDTLGNEDRYEVSKLFHVKNSDEIGAVEYKVDKNGKALLGNDLKEFKLKINKMYPPGIRELIFIPGEKLEHIFDPKYSKEIKDFAITNSELPSLRNLEALFKKYYDYVDDKRKKEQKKEKTLNDLNEKLTSEQKKRTEKEAELTEITDLMNKTEEAQKKLNDKLEKFEEIQDIIDEYRKLDNKHNQLIAQQEKDLTHFSDLMKRYSIFLYLEEATKKIMEDIQSKNFPEIISRDTAIKLLKRPECCCGRKWDEAMKEHMKNYINNQPQGEKSKIAFVFNDRLRDKVNKFPQFKTEILDYYKNLVELNNKIRTTKNNLKTLGQKHPLIEEQKGENFYKEFQRIRTELNKAGELLRNLEKQKAGIETEIFEIDKKINNINGQIKKAETELTKEFEWSKARDHIIILKEILKKIIEIYNSELKEQTKQNITKLYKEISNFPDSISKVEIYDSGGKKDGWNVVPFFKEKGISIEHEIIFTSTGETHILGLAYIMGIANTLNVKLPLIFDSPFVHIDNEAKETLAENVPMCMNEGQIIYFVKDSEMSEEVDKALNQYVGKEVNLQVIKRWYQNKINN